MDSLYIQNDWNCFKNNAYHLFMISVKMAPTWEVRTKYNTTNASVAVSECLNFSFLHIKAKIKMHKLKKALNSIKTKIDDS